MKSLLNSARAALLPALTLTLSLAATSLALTGCSSSVTMPVINNFSIDDYLGTWYEIARIDNRFERGLSQVSAEYSKQNGEIKVINRGFSAEQNRWKEAIGKARFAGDSNAGRLEVSFFGPFYGDYQILAASKDKDGRYRTALVAGDSLDYLWLLSREPRLSDAEKAQFTDKIIALGVDPKSLIWL